MTIREKFSGAITNTLLVAIAATGCAVEPEEQNYEWYKAQSIDDFFALVATSGKDYQVTTHDNSESGYFDVSIQSTSDHHICIPFGRWPRESLDDYQKFEVPALDDTMADRVYVQIKTQKYSVRTGHKYCVDTTSYEPVQSNAALFQCLLRVEPHGIRTAVLPYTEFSDLPNSASAKILVFDTTAFFCD